MTIIDKITISKLKKLGDNFTEDDMIRVALSLSEKDFDDLPLSEYKKYLKELKSFKKKSYPFLNYKDYTFYYIDINNISFGEYIDIKNFFIKKRFDLLLPIFYRLEKEEPSDLEDRKLEDWGSFDLMKRSKILSNQSFKYIHQIENDFLNLEKKIRTNYPLFDEEVEDAAPAFEDVRDLKRWEIEKKKKENYDKMAWSFILYNLSSGDITKYNDILKLSIWTVFNHLKIMKYFNDKKD